MKKAGCLLVLCSCLLLLVVPAQAQNDPHHQVHIIEGLVVGVSEGDRLTVNSYGTEIPVRLYGIAAPQTAKIDRFTGWYKQGQPYAEDAFRALSLKVLHQVVRIEIRETLVFKTEPTQVAVAVVFLDGRNINLEMVNDGWAWAYRRLLSRGDHPQYFATERMARARRNGLWTQENPQPPWEFKPHLKVKAKQN
ncbi:thermonuclease family protein [Geomonas paludis]|uniref:Nuclease n=1 Tax=Geomonas paludis TaxID=2740185 RepID=A0A6V8MY50_9BACT|nr:thermonuclease family protein [Geomonas paludis]UPU34163.1 thermonuclease family protein [Geomonas paludis]GFO64139.1 nuclease [Geomonas paludis]